MCNLFMLRQSFGFIEIKMNVLPPPVFWEGLKWNADLADEEMKSKHRAAWTGEESEVKAAVANRWA